jgi:hypothetical protein
MHWTSHRSSINHYSRKIRVRYPHEKHCVEAACVSLYPGRDQFDGASVARVAGKEFQKYSFTVANNSCFGIYLGLSSQHPA